MAKAPATCLGCFYHPGKRKSGSEASKSGFKGWKKPWWEQLLSWVYIPISSHLTFALSVP